MALQLDNFLHSLCRDLVARAAAQTPAVSLVYPVPGTPATPAAKASLFRGRAIESVASDLYTVVRISGGAGTTWDPLPRLSLQFWTLGPAGASVEAALNRAQTLFETLLDSDGHPSRMRTMNGYKAADNAADGHWTIVSIDPLQRPGPLGPDSNRREQVSFNADLGYYKKD